MPLTDLLDDAIRRLHGKHLLGAAGSVSVRLPGTQDMRISAPGEAAERVPLAAARGTQAWHAAIYRARADVGAIALGGGVYGRMLGKMGGGLPQVFDEQARHLGRTAPPLADLTGDPATQATHGLAAGGNVWIGGTVVLVFGTTTQRLMLNAELLEKCAKAYVLAHASGGRVHMLPWWVCRIANARLAKDQARAAARFAQGLLPDEAKGY